MRPLYVWGLALFLFATAVAHGAAFTFSKTNNHLDILRNGKIWLRTMTTPYSSKHPEDTYKVFTHIYDFAGKAPITKGPGGKYSHHRGLFIGWRDTRHNGDPSDTWHMKNASQRHRAWKSTGIEGDAAVQVEAVDWCDERGKTFLHETRTIRVQPGANDARIIDFESELAPVNCDVEFRGDPHHGGMQVRLANEVIDHPDTTRFILPKGASRLDYDRVVGAWWVCCSAVINGSRYWILHMTPQSNPTGQPVYAIRPYGRLGAFFEPDVSKGEKLDLRFRIIVSKMQLDREQCQALYDSYRSGSHS